MRSTSRSTMMYRGAVALDGGNYGEVFCFSIIFAIPAHAASNETTKPNEKG
jgi:hypothetical protein